MFEVLTSYDETMHYLEVPGWLSEASDIGYQYGGFSEHLMMSLTDIFCIRDKFEKLTELDMLKLTLTSPLSFRND